MRKTLIPPGDYPVLPGAAMLSRQLRAPGVTAAVERVLTENVTVFADAVGAVIGRMDPASGAAQLYQDAHEIRGLAGNARLTATSRIASGLCRYLDTLAGAERSPDRTVVLLHIEALAQSARAGDGPLGEAVARELAELVAKKVAEINIPETAP
jgi:hypothetical protein